MISRLVSPFDKRKNDLIRVSSESTEFILVMSGSLHKTGFRYLCRKRVMKTVPSILSTFHFFNLIRLGLV